MWPAAVTELIEPAGLLRMGGALASQVMGGRGSREVLLQWGATESLAVAAIGAGEDAADDARGTRSRFW